MSLHGLLSLFALIQRQITLLLLSHQPSVPLLISLIGAITLPLAYAISSMLITKQDEPQSAQPLTCVLSVHSLFHFILHKRKLGFYISLTIQYLPSSFFIYLKQCFDIYIGHKMMLHGGRLWRSNIKIKHWKIHFL